MAKSLSKLHTNYVVRDKDENGKPRVCYTESILNHQPTEEELVILESHGVKYVAEDWVYVWKESNSSDTAWFENLKTGVRTCEFWTNDFDNSCWN